MEDARDGDVFAVDAIDQAVWVARHQPFAGALDCPLLTQERELRQPITGQQNRARQLLGMLIVALTVVGVDGSQIVPRRRRQDDRHVVACCSRCPRSRSRL